MGKQILKLNKAAIDLMHFYESLELEAYPDPASPLGKACTAKKLPMRSYKSIPNWIQLSGRPWTIGWGHTGPEVNSGMVISKERADQIFQEDSEHFCKGVARLVTVPLTDNQFGALVSLVYNIGLARFSESTLLKKLNAGDYAGAAAQFAVWRKAGGQVLPGLVARREKERLLFCS